MRNGLVQLIRMEKSIGQIWVSVFKRWKRNGKQCRHRSEQSENFEQKCTFIIPRSPTCCYVSCSFSASETNFLHIPVVTYTPSAQPASYSYTESSEYEEQLSPVIPPVIQTSDISNDFIGKGM